MLFTACLLGAAVLGGFVGSCCAKGRRTGDCEARVADIEERLDALADHVMEELKLVKDRHVRLAEGVDAFQTRCLEQEQAIHAQLDEHDLLIGETPEDGLLGRVGALEEAKRKEEKHD